jgi:hypothetical protein
MRREKRQMCVGGDRSSSTCAMEVMRQVFGCQVELCHPWGFDRVAVELGSLYREPQLGDLVVTRVVGLGAHDHVENTRGRRVRLQVGDVVVGAFGNRYATDYDKWYLPTGTVAHFLTAGGVVGWVASARARRAGPVVPEVRESSRAGLGAGTGQVTGSGRGTAKAAGPWRERVRRRVLDPQWPSLPASANGLDASSGWISRVRNSGQADALVMRRVPVAAAP